jgi:hypothetical protein
MIFWILYFSIDGQFTLDYPYHFAYRETCATIGEKVVKEYKYEAFRCVKEVIE